MTQEELAGDVGVDPKHISRIENGRKLGSDQMIRRISEVTGKPLSFFYGDEPMPDDASDKEEILMKYRKATARQQKLIESLIDAVISVCSTKPLKKSRTALDTRGERLRCFEFDEMAGI